MDKATLEKWAEEEAAAVAAEKARVAALCSADHHTRCRDCGVFVDKRRWVKKDSFNAIQHQQRPLCGPCWSEYDHEPY